MSLNIKNVGTCDLVAKVAKLTGESKTRAIHVALEQRLENMGGLGIEAAQLLEIGKRCAQNIQTKINVDELLYDDMGLPK